MISSIQLLLFPENICKKHNTLLTLPILVNCCEGSTSSNSVLRFDEHSNCMERPSSIVLGVVDMLLQEVAASTGPSIIISSAFTLDPWDCGFDEHWLRYFNFLSCGTNWMDETDRAESRRSFPWWKNQWKTKNKISWASQSACFETTCFINKHPWSETVIADQRGMLTH